VILRRLVVVVVALLLATQVVRNAAVRAIAPLHPESASTVWPGHPTVEISLGLAEIGRASRTRMPIDPATFAMIDDAAVKSPLSPDPFLVRGVQLRNGGDGTAAKNAFLAAQRRDPRSLPAAYFLADHYFRAGDSLSGLQQTALLARLSPGGTAAVAPFIAVFARDPAHWPEMRSMFRSEQPLEGAVLTSLAQDPRNLDALLALADSSHRKPDSPWLGVVLNKLVAQGDYGRAHALWSAIGGGDAKRLVFDTGFANPVPPPPFNWALATSGVGLAERQPGGRLHVIFYGNVDGILASQLVAMPAGPYRVRMELAGAPVHAETLHWSIRCAKSGEVFASAGVDEAASRGWTFVVPADCGAQWLELSGRSGDIAQQAEVTIAGFTVTRTAANA
jgi:hypothetical protein